MIGDNIAARRGATTVSCMGVTDMPASKFLPGWAVKDLVDVHLLRLAHRECDCPRERVGWHCHLRIEGPNALRRIGIGDTLGELGRDRTRRNDRGPDIVRLDLLTQPSHFVAA
jgi:hypothetical protein